MGGRQRAGMTPRVWPGEPGGGGAFQRNRDAPAECTEVLVTGQPHLSWAVLCQGLRAQGGKEATTVLPSRMPRTRVMVVVLILTLRGFSWSMGQGRAPNQPWGWRPASWWVAAILNCGPCQGSRWRLRMYPLIP